MTFNYKTQRIQKKVNNDDESDACHACLTPKKYELLSRDTSFHKVRRPYIMDGYLDISGYHLKNGIKLSWISGVWSAMFTLHNEVINIHTHLWPSIFILIYIIYEWNVYNITILNDFEMFILFLLMISFLFMLSLSWYYHVGRCIYPKLHDYYLCMDFFGVVLMFLSSYISLIFIGFECYYIWQIFYCIITCIIIFIIFVPTLCLFPHKTSFVSKLCILGISGGISTIILPLHAFYLNPNMYDYFLYHGISFFIIYFIGFTVFIKRIPESLNPGKFDIYFNSHQIWHLCIVSASLIWWHGLHSVQHNNSC